METAQQASAYDKLRKELSTDPRCIKEINSGKRIGFYRIQQKLGDGAFAKVMLGVHCLVKAKVAIKIVNKMNLDDKSNSLLQHEVACMQKLAHPYLIRLHEVLETTSHIYMISEYAMQGDLTEKVETEGRLKEPLAMRYYSQILSAVTYMHQNNIIHRDIKAPNVLLSWGDTCKVADLGFCRTVHSPNHYLDTFCGSPPYAAPELFKDDHYLGRYVDIWALGILLFYMVVGETPFAAPTVGMLKRNILTGSFTIPAYISPHLRYLITNILMLIPEHRFTLPEIMRSKWMEGVRYIGPLRSNRLRPPLDSEESDTIETNAVMTLNNYGITNEMISQCPLDLRNQINGTYRLAFFIEEKKAWRKTLKEEEDALYSRKLLLENASAKDSKVCALL